MSEPLLYRLLYRSEASIAGSGQTVETTVESIVRASVEANAAVGITGSLVFTSGAFIQALEGPLASVEATFERICRDLRHRRLQLLAVATADRRVFADWSMVRSHPGVDLVRIWPASAAVCEPQLQQTKAAEAIRLMRIALLSRAGQPRRAQPPALDPTPAGIALERSNVATFEPMAG